MSGGGWNTIESDAGVFTYLVDMLGVKKVQFEELLDLDADSLAQLHPVHGVIFLFKFPTDAPYRGTGGQPLDGTYDYEASEHIFFATQTIQNACGTQALLSVLLNKTAAAPAHAIDVGPTLGAFRDFAMVLPPEMRGEALSNAPLIRDVHNSFARASPFVDETARDDDDDGGGDVFHFVAYAALRGQLYELDGLQPAPIVHGPCDDAQFPARVMAVLRRRIARYDDAEIRFNLLAVCGDRRDRARVLGDADMMAREERKRRAWQAENALRRHNFVGFAAQVLHGVVEMKLAQGGDAAYDAWVAAATDSMRRSRRRQGAGHGGDDVDMAG